MKTGDRFDIPHEGESWHIVRSAIHDGPPFIADVTIAAGKGPPTHFHEHEDEVIEVFEGSVTFFMPDGPHEVKAGERFTIPRGTPHSFKTGAQGMRGRGVYDGVHFEGFVAQLPPGDKKGFIRLAQHATATNWIGSRLTSPLLRAFFHVLGKGGWLFGVRRRIV